MCGLNKYGRGDWRNISRNCVKTRTPTQVASHAQKYFKRMETANKGKKKMCINNITILDHGKLLTLNVSVGGQVSGVSSGKKTRRSCPKVGGASTDLVSSSTADRQIDKSTARGSKQKTEASDACSIPNPMPNLKGVSISQQASSGKTIGGNGCLIPHRMPNSHGIPISKGPDWSMIGAGDIAFTSSSQGISIPQIPSTNMIRAPNVDFVSGYQDTSVPQAQNTGVRIGVTEAGFISSFQGIPSPQNPSSGYTVGAADACFASGHPRISVPQSQNFAHMGGAFDVESHRGILVPQAPSSGHVIGAGNVGFTPNHQSLSIPRASSGAHVFGATDVRSLSIPQEPSIEDLIGAPDVDFYGDPMAGQRHVSFAFGQSSRTGGAIGGGSSVGTTCLITGQQSFSTLQGPIPGQVLMDSGVDFSNPQITSLHNTPTSHGQAGAMTGDDIDGSYMVDFDDFPSDFDFSIISSLIDDSPLSNEPSTSPSVSVSLPYSIPSMDDSDDPFSRHDLF